MNLRNEKTWWKESVVYQIYPRSFCDSNHDGIGDLGGILKKLDYLDELGVDILWLSPIYQSPNDDNGYDISDYRSILTDFGTMEEFETLLAEVHRRGMRLIMDLVVNHTSDEHEWFIQSRKNCGNPYRDYYIWKNGKNGQPPNNWGSWFGGPAWEYDEKTDMYYLHIFSKKQPDLNWENETLRKEIYDMMRWWLNKGVDGFRMDVISLLSKNQQFPDGEKGNGIYGDLVPFCAHGPRIHDFLREMNREVLSKYDIMTVGEAACVTLEEAKKYAGIGRNELDTVFQFEHVELGSGEYGKWTDAAPNLIELKQIFKKWIYGLEGIAWNTLFWCNHDQPRAVSRFGNDGKHRVLSAKMLATCLHMMKGTPYIYQGEEIGMTNANFVELNQYRDVESLNAFHENVEIRGLEPDKMMLYLQKRSRDNARTPMQWNTTDYAGFSDVAPWIEVNKNYTEINAEQALADKESIFHYYKRLIELRHKMEIIVYGGFEMLMEDDEQIFAYKRSMDGQTLVVFCNFTENDVLCTKIPTDANVLVSNYSDGHSKYLRPYEAVVYELTN